MAAFTFVLCPTKYRAGATWHIVSRYNDQSFCGKRQPLDPAWPRATDAAEVWETGVGLCDNCDHLSYRKASKFLNTIPDGYEPLPAGDLAVGDRVRWYGADRTILSRRNASKAGGDGRRLLPKRRVGFALDDWPGEVVVLAETPLLRSRGARSCTDPSGTTGTAI